MRYATRNGFKTLLAIVLFQAATQTALAAPRQDLPLSRNYQDVKVFMQQLAQAYPTRVKLFTLGVSDKGEAIVGMQIGNGARNNVKNLVVAAHHGNEYGSVEVAKAFAWSVADAPLTGQTVYVIPVLNTSGFDARNRYERNQAGRSADPNRDYPGPCGTEGPFLLRSTAALAGFIAREGIVASATLHTYYPAVVYPWGLSTRDLSTPYDDLFKMLAKAATVESHYQTGNGTEVIYPADGTFEDYAFWKHGIWSLLFELGPSHSPTLSQVREMQRVNVPGLRRMLEQAPRQRAENHAFTGKCDTSLRSRDRHNE